MAPEKQIFDPDGDLTFILPCASPSTATSSSSATDVSSLKHKEPAKEAHVHMQVSSKHMMLASPVFKAMLTHSFQEGNTLRDTGHVDIPLPHDDPVIFTIILDIIHGRGSRVPRVVPLKMLPSLAIAVDKYQLQEPVRLLSDTWIRNIVEKTIAQGEDGLLLWLGISWVFQDSKKFHEVTKMLIREGKGLDLRHLEMELHIPQRALDTIQTQRREIIRSLYEKVDLLAARYTESDGSLCNYVSAHTVENCDATVLGHLIRDFSNAKLWPAPQPPYLEVSISHLVKTMKATRARSLCGHPKHNFDFVTVLTNGSAEIEKNLVGVDLKGFVH